MSSVWERTSRLSWERSGRVGNASPKMARGVAIEVAFAGEAGPPGEDREGDDLALGEGGIGTGAPFRRTGVAEVVDDDVECGEEGVHVEHEGPVPFLWGSVGKPTLARGHL